MEAPLTYDQPKSEQMQKVLIALWEPNSGVFVYFFRSIAPLRSIQNVILAELLFPYSILLLSGEMKLQKRIRE